MKFVFRSRSILFQLKCIVNLAVIAALALCLIPLASAQTDGDVAHWLDRETTALLKIDDVPTTVDRISELEIFSNPRFLKAIEMLTDERFPIVKPEDMPKVWEKLDDVKNLIKQIGAISFVIHKYDDKEFTWSIFLTADEEILDNAEAEFGSANKLIKNSVTLGKPKKPESGFNEPETDELLKTDAQQNEEKKEEPEDSEAKLEKNEDLEITDHGWCKACRVGKWFLISNNPTFIQSLPNRMEDKTFRSLAKSRKYRAVGLRKSPLNKEDGRVSIYAMPDQLRHFFPRQSEDAWKLQSINELPAVGVNVVITQPELDSTKPVQPIILADAVIKHTEPAQGYAKKFKSLKTFEIPPLAVDPIELVARGKDETTSLEESVRAYDAKYGEGAAEKHWQAHFAGTGIDIFEDAVLRRKAMFQMRFVDEDHFIDQPGLLTLDSVEDYWAAKRFAEGIVKNGLQFHGLKMLPKESDGLIWWMVSGLDPQTNTGFPHMDRLREQRIDFMNPTQDAFVLSNDWFVQGDMPAVKQQMDLFDGGEGEDYGKPLREMMSDLTKRLKPYGPIVMAKYYTPYAWQENINVVESNYAHENTTPIELKVDWSEIQRQGIYDFGIVTDPESGSREYQFQFQPGQDKDANQDGNEEAAHEPVPLQPVEESEKDKDESEDGSQEESGFHKFKVMMPMPLTQRNEDGYRFELKDRRALQKAVEVMMLTSLAESFPRQMFLYSKENGHIRILGGAYRATKSEDETGVRLSR